MKIGALHLFQRCNSYKGKKSSIFNLAAWHWDWSITWSWIFSYDYQISPYQKRWFYFLRKCGYKGFYFHAGITIPYIGKFSFENQPSMKPKNK